MKSVWLLLTVYVAGTYAGQLIERNEVTVITQDDSESSNNRSSRKLFKKIHNGAAFLAGIKLGEFLSSKGQLLPSLGHGSLATSHNFQIFGKTVSSALSLTYGNGQLPLPLHDPIGEDATNQSLSRLPTQNVLITILDNPDSQTLEKLKSIAKVRENTSNRTFKTTHSQEMSQLNSLVNDHNRRISIINQTARSPARINSKFK